MIPELSTKEDTQRACEMWNHFWAGDMLKRPIVLAEVPIDPSVPATKRDHALDRPYYNAATGDYEREIRHIDDILDNTLYMAESIPSFPIDHGPDQMAAVIGGSTLHFSDNIATTNWVEPVVEDWAEFDIRLNEESPIWQSLLTYSQRLREHGRGRYVVRTLDYHSNGDALSALRNPQRLCMDFYDVPERIDKAMADVRKIFPRMYNRLYEAGGMAETGTSCWIPLWCEGKYATIQCDFICMVSPDIACTYILPALEEEASFLDHCIYHLDGPGALVHLDNLLAIQDIDAIQWVSGAGQKPMHEWTDVFKKCQKAGKKLIIYCGSKDPLGIIKQTLSELKPAGLIFSMGAEKREDVEETLRWLERNT
jgi:hypothetical protein